MTIRTTGKGWIPLCGGGSMKQGIQGVQRASPRDQTDLMTTEYRSHLCEDARCGDHAHRPSIRLRWQ
eukprot:scaffold158601_cov30-Tisochrysis_lutea.AAC.5